MKPLGELALARLEQPEADRAADRVRRRVADVPEGVHCVSEIVAGAGGVRAREDLAVQRALRQLLKRQVRQREVILSVVRAGVPRSEDPSEHFAAATRQQRVEPVATLVVSALVRP